MKLSKTGTAESSITNFSKKPVIRVEADTKHLRCCCKNSLSRVAPLSTGKRRFFDVWRWFCTMSESFRCQHSTHRRMAGGCAAGCAPALSGPFFLTVPSFPSVSFTHSLPLPFLPSFLPSSLPFLLLWLSSSFHSQSSPCSHQTELLPDFEVLLCWLLYGVDETGAPTAI